MKSCKKHPAFFVILSMLVFSAVPAMADNGSINTTRGPDKQLILNLVTIDPGNIETFVDGFNVLYNNGYLASTVDDIEKVSKIGENITSYRESKDLQEERRPLFSATDTIFLHITNTGTRDYRFKINMQYFNITGLMARLDDLYLNTSRILDTYGGSDDIDFSVTTDPASADPFRFRIVFITASPLPVTITGFAAMQVGKNIMLEWKVSNQLNMVQYEVERSANGIHFARVATQPVTGSASSYTYQWLDEHATTGNVQYPADIFYRIRCVGIAGYIRYSKVISVKTGNSSSDISIYPNPVTNSMITLQFTNMQKGIYGLRLINGSGQALLTKTIDHNGSNSTQTVMPLSNMAKGNYYLEINGPGDLKMSKLVSVTNR